MNKPLTHRDAEYIKQTALNLFQAGVDMETAPFVDTDNVCSTIDEVFKLLEFGGFMKIENQGVLPNQGKVEAVASTDN